MVATSRSGLLIYYFIHFIVSSNDSLRRRLDTAFHRTDVLGGVQIGLRSVRWDGMRTTVLAILRARVV